METIYDEEENDDSSDNSEDVVLVKLDRDFTLEHDNDLLFAEILQSGCCFSFGTSSENLTHLENFGILDGNAKIGFLSYNTVNEGLFSHDQGLLCLLLFSLFTVSLYFVFNLVIKWWLTSHNITVL